MYLFCWDLGIMREELSGQSQEPSSFQEAWPGRHGAEWGRVADPSPRLLLLSLGIKDHSLNVC